ncbi:MAG TPA: hypothetical protein VLK65_22505 [Vicinamibacteria bacterium]|nr:hypothetical protein [Vicinamibacteria bacterium]
MSTERVTITLPREVVESIDCRARNRSRFILEAVLRELDRIRREELRLSLRQPHAESDVVADLGDWGTNLPDEEVGELLDPKAGRRVQWRSGVGWTTADED